MVADGKKKKKKPYLIVNWLECLTDESVKCQSVGDRRVRYCVLSDS